MTSHGGTAAGGEGAGGGNLKNNVPDSVALRKRKKNKESKF